jgi:hypothetical protein
VEFHVANALFLVDWWNSNGLDKRFNKPFMTCVNSTLNIMPEQLRGSVVEQLLNLAGPTRLCMVSYLNGNFSLGLVEQNNLSQGNTQPIAPQKG